MATEANGRITVLGAGTMGHGIAHAAMTAGFDTSLFDTSNDALVRAKAAIDAVIAKSVELKKTSEAEAKFLKGRLRTFDHLAQAVAHADVVIEAVPEQIDLKLRVLREVEKHAPAPRRHRLEHVGAQPHRDGGGADASRRGSAACTSSIPSTR